MADEPLVSFVVTCYNYGQYLGDCLDSILREQTTRDYEIIVVDDASTDNTPQVVLARMGQRISFIRFTENRGLGAAIEQGLIQARGRFVKSLDADDRLSAGYLERVLPILERYPKVGAVYGDIAAIDERGAILEDPWSGIRSRAVHSGQEFRGDEFLQIVEENFVPSPSLIARRTALATVLPLPAWLPRHFGPMDWYLILAIARDHDLYYLPETLAEYRLHSRNNHTKKLADRTREIGVLGVLDHLFAQPDRAPQKRRIRRRVYGKTFYYFGTRYLESNMLAEARRCYRKAAACEPLHLARFEWWRRSLAAYLGLNHYNAIKNRLPLRESLRDSKDFS